jgi:hypothetical protein
MVEIEKDLQGNSLTREEEINFIYEGSSFENRMEISSLTSQLKATETIIRDLVSEMYKQKGLKKPEETKIYIKLKRGSFHEIISIIFNNPTTAAIIGGSVVAIITHFLNGEKKKSDIKIENLINNYTFAKNINYLINALEDKSDKLKIISSNPNLNVEVSFDNKNKIRANLIELKKQVAIEVYQEEFFGYLSVLYLDKEKYKFTLEGTDKAIQTEFDESPTLKQIKELLGFRLKINARATYEEKELKKIEIESYQIKTRKNLNDFLKKK